MYAWNASDSKIANALIVCLLDQMGSIFIWKQTQTQERL